MPANIKRLLKELKQGLARLYGGQLIAVYLYGSYARGEARPDSDIDVVIILDHYEHYSDEIERTGELVSELSLAYGKSISRVIITSKQWQKSDTPLLQNIRAEGLPA